MSIEQYRKSWNADVSLYQRYKNGEQRQVWTELRSIPNADCWQNEDIVDVARDTMDRIAKNADLISDRLKRAGWFALSSDFTDFRTYPDPKDREVIEQIQNMIGVQLPLALNMFWTRVGGINWVWDYERSTPRPTLGVVAPLDELDPLCVDPPEAGAYAVDTWMDEDYQAYFDLEPGQYRLDLAPDDLHKANISGGDPYSILLPTDEADPTFDCGAKSRPFTDYLRHCFKWAGFPGLEDYAEQKDVIAFVGDFTEGLVPF